MRENNNTEYTGLINSNMTVHVRKILNELGGLVELISQKPEGHIPVNHINEFVEDNEMKSYEENLSEKIRNLKFDVLHAGPNTSSAISPKRVSSILNHLASRIDNGISKRETINEIKNVINKLV